VIATLSGAALAVLLLLVHERNESADDGVGDGKGDGTGGEIDEDPPIPPVVAAHRALRNGPYLKYLLIKAPRLLLEQRSWLSASPPLHLGYYDSGAPFPHGAAPLEHALLLHPLWHAARGKTPRFPPSKTAPTVILLNPLQDNASLFFLVNVIILVFSFAATPVFWWLARRFGKRPVLLANSVGGVLLHLLVKSGSHSGSQV